jgi:hypothetical protein
MSSVAVAEDMRKKSQVLIINRTSTETIEMASAPNGGQSNKTNENESLNALLQSQYR